MKENTLGVGLNKLAEEGSHEASFLSVYEDKFTADVSFFFSTFFPVQLFSMGPSFCWPCVRVAAP